MKKDVFISYARSDYKDRFGNEIPDNAISKIKRAFDNAGLTYWIDEDGIGAGQEWSDLISPAILDSLVFVFVSSKNSNNHKFTKSEVAIAHEYEKHIIPFRIDDTKYNSSIVVHLAGLEYIAYGADPDKSCLKLVQAVETYKEKIRNIKQAEQEEIERQRRIEEIDNELKLQYEQKSSIDYKITESQQALLTVEQELHEVLSSISELEKNKRMLSGDDRSFIKDCISIGSEVSGTTGLPSTFKQFCRMAKNTSKIICLQYGLLCFCVLLLICIGFGGIFVEHYQRQRDSDSYKQSFLKVDSLVNRLWKKDLICEIAPMGSFIDTSFFVQHQKGDLIQLLCTLPVGIREDFINKATIDSDGEREHLNSRYYYGRVTLQLDGYCYDSDENHLINNQIIYQFRNSGKSRIRVKYESRGHKSDFHKGKAVYLTLFFKDSTMNEIYQICEDNTGHHGITLNHYNNNDLFR